ncbi:MAG: DEAD/DEAH box helicase family protein [Myxococcota bacterium]|nr:DEAD/DEAH box helicase family protein [Myxococcota bacterium]
MNLTLEFDRGTLLISPRDLPDDCIPAGFVRDTRAGGRLRAMALEYRRALATLIRAGYTVDDRARAYRQLNRRPRETRVPYPHQREAHEAWLAQRRRGVVVLPTGAGKSFVAEMAIASTQRSTLVIVPTLDLVAQWASNLEHAFGPPIGLIGGGSFQIEDITVSTYDSAYLHMDRFGDRFGLVIFDEAHHLPGESMSQAAELSIAPYRLGLTATPERPDGRHQLLDTLIGPIVLRRTVTELSGEYLADYETIRIDVELSESERMAYDAARAEYRGFVETKGIRLGGPGGWRRFIEATSRSAEGRAALQAYLAQKRLAQASQSKVDRLGELLQRHKNEKLLFFTAENRAVHEISRRYLVPVITHETPTAERRAILDGLGSGRWNVVGTSRVLNEGVDMPDVSIGVILSGSGSVREHVQRLGRILRRREGKRAVLYELVTADTAESYTSERRRAHEAYR